MEISAENIRPKILRAERFNFYSDNRQEYSLAPRRCYNYELEYFTYSQGGVIVQGEYIELRPGEINFRRPGQVVCGVPPYRGYIICFTLTDLPISREGYVFGCPEEADADCKNPLMDLLPSKIQPKKPEDTKKLFLEIIQNNYKPDPLSRFKSNTILSTLLADLFSQEGEMEPPSYHLKAILAKKYIGENYTEEINVDELIRESGLSKPYFHKCFKQLTGTTPLGLATRLRIEKAKTLLQLTQDSIGDIAASCGYMDNVYFTHLFKSHVGMTPTKYRKSLDPDI